MASSQQSACSNCEKIQMKLTQQQQQEEAGQHHPVSSSCSGTHACAVASVMCRTARTVDVVHTLLRYSKHASLITHHPAQLQRLWCHLGGFLMVVFHILSTQHGTAQHSMVLRSTALRPEQHLELSRQCQLQTDSRTAMAQLAQQHTHDVYDKQGPHQLLRPLAHVCSSTQSSGSSSGSDMRANLENQCWV